MILYFSATGNSEHVARRIAAATSDKVMSIERFDAEILHLAVMEGPCRLGFVAPVYAWGLPTPMIEFLKTVDLSVAAGTRGGERPYTFYVSTYGSTTGQSAKFARDLLHERGLELDAAMSVKMPDTWTPVFDLSDPQKVEGINRAAEAQIDAVIEAVRARRTGNMMRHRVPLFASCAYHAIGLPRMQQTASLPSMPIAASAAACVPSAAPWRRLRCATAFPSGQSRSAQPAFVACTVVPNLPSRTVSARHPTVSTGIPSQV